jgi:DHA1 family tetracycline resistance protein-like MFS transporter
MPQIRGVLVTLCLTALSFIAISANISLFAKDRLNWDTTSVGTLFSVFGITSILGQAILLPWLLKRLGPSQVAIIGFFLAAISFVMVAAVATTASSTMMYLSFVLIAIAEGLISPSLLDLLTRATDAQSQGKVQGGNQSIQSLANMAGPLYVGVLYDSVGHAVPYWSGAVIILLALVTMYLSLPNIRQSTVSEEKSPA